MNFIEVRPNIKLRKSSITKIRRLDDMRCEVFCDEEWEESIYPYQTLAMLLEMGNIEEKISTTPPVDNPSRNLYGAQHWAG
jgi:hypothetical protein